MKSKRINKKLIRSILRSQIAFELYSNNRLYYQALRIKKANEEVYSLLQKYMYNCKDEIFNDIIAYIFHLEDWFVQFSELERTNNNLEEVFIFERFVDSPEYPKKIIIKLSEEI